MNHGVRSFLIVLTCLLLTGEARAGTKEELIRLQNDVLALQNQIRLLEKAFSEQTESIKGLVAQLNDQVGKSNLLLEQVSTTLSSQSAGGNSANQMLLQEIRSLSSKVDDTATRISALARQISEIKVESQAIAQRRFQTATGENLALSADVIYNEAFTDLVQGNFDLAIEGFNAFIKNFPSSENADNAIYNIGEAYYNSNRYREAISAFTRVLTDYPAGDKVASAHFKRAKAELAIGERDNASEDFRLVVQKFPSAPEASLSRMELESLGIDPTKPARSTSTRRRPE